MRRRPIRQARAGSYRPALDLPIKSANDGQLLRMSDARSSRKATARETFAPRAARNRTAIALRRVPVELLRLPIGARAEADARPAPGPCRPSPRPARRAAPWGRRRKSPCRRTLSIILLVARADGRARGAAWSKRSSGNFSVPLPMPPLIQHDDLDRQVVGGRPSPSPCRRSRSQSRRRPRRSAGPGAPPRRRWRSPCRCPSCRSCRRRGGARGDLFGICVRPMSMVLAPSPMMTASSGSHWLGCP